MGVISVDPTELLTMLARRPGIAGGPPAAPPSSDPTDALRGAISNPAAPPAATSTPPPTDDPAISPRAAKAPIVPQAPDMTNSPVLQELTKAKNLSDQISAIKQPNPNDYKPSLLRRILSVPLATAAGLGNPAAGARASDEILGAPYQKAQNNYQAQVGPLQKQLEYERETSIPLAEASARIPQQDYENKEKQYEDEEKQFEAGNEVGDKVFQETGPDGKTKYYQTTKTGEKREVPTPKSVIDDQRKRDEDANTPAPGARPEADPENKNQFRIKTKSGGYMPWSPKSIDEGALYGYPGAKNLYDEAHRDKSAEASGQNGWTPSEQREINQRTRPMETRINALERTRSLLVGSTDNQDQAQLAALDKEIDDQHKQIDSVENDVMSRRKGGAPSGSPQKPFSVPAGAPSAKGVADGRPLKMNGQTIAIAKGGQWVAPESKQ